METVKSKENVLKGLGSLLPILTVIIIILGLIKQYLFYLNFNIPIKYFIGITELGLIVSGDLLVFVPLAFIFYIFMIFFANYKFNKKIEKNITSNTTSKDKLALIPENLVESTPNKKRKGSNYGYGVFMTICLIVIIIGAVYQGYKSYILLGGFLVLYVVMILLSYKKEFIDDLLPTIHNKLTVIFFSFLILYVSFTISDEITLTEKGKYIGTIITTADSTYISTDSSFFIGKTEKYVFIYNKKNKKTRIIPSELVTSIDMSSK